MADVIAYIQANGSMVLMVLLGISEALALIPSIGANSIVQAVIGGLKSLIGLFAKKE